MSEVTSAYSVYDLVLLVAKATKIAYYGSDAQQEAMVPVDYHDFNRCLNVVNEGIKRFVSDAPPEGWNWQKRSMAQTFGIVETTGAVDSGGATTLVDATLADTYDTDDDLNGYYVYDQTKKIQAVITDYTALTGTITVAAWLDYYGNSSSLTPAASDSFAVTDVQTINGEKHRYFLPDDFGEIAGPIEYAKNSGVGHMGWTSYDELRRMYAVSNSLGNPMTAAMRSYLNRKWELMVYPSPTAAKTVEIPYRVGFNGLKALSGLASSGSDTTLVDSSFANVFPADYFNGWTITTHDGTGKNGYAVVTDFTGTTCTFTVADWLSLSDKSTAAATDPTANTSYFVTDGLRHPVGQQFDVAIRAAILAEAQSEFGALEFDALGEYLKIYLPRAYELDGRINPRTVGRMKPGHMRGYSGSHHPRQHRSWIDVSYN